MWYVKSGFGIYGLYSVYDGYWKDSSYSGTMAHESDGLVFTDSDCSPA